jgi:sulfoxide reductase catalytic subunit YedY
LNGFPLVLVVPGYFADNWVKMIERIHVMEKDEPVFYTDHAYRLPAINPFDSVLPGDPMPEQTRPLKKLKIKSVIAAPAENSKFSKSDRVTMRGVAFDGGFGIKEVLVSVDGGETWTTATLGEDLGRYAFRSWTYTFKPNKAGHVTLMSRAINRLGETQPLPQNIEWNPAGYQWNAADTLVIQVV